MAGDVTAARQLLEQQAPGLLASSGGAGRGGGGGGRAGGVDLRFHLACQEYVELIRSARGSCFCV
jgi:hypothetical protein